MDAVIGVDIGTQSTKAVLVGPGGAILAQASRGYAPDTPRPNWAEQWPDVWLGAVEQCIAAVARTAGADVKALCVSSLYGGSGIPVDGAMEPLHPCLIWMDRRAEAQVAWVKAHVDLQRLGAVTASRGTRHDFRDIGRGDHCSRGAGLTCPRSTSSSTSRPCARGDTSTTRAG